MVNAASLWSPGDYSRHGAFVPELGRPVVDLLAPKPGELILDVGCGDGALTAHIAEAGARVIGLDSSSDMVEAARARGLDAFVADAETLGLPAQADRFGQFDAIFSNAALHWMLDARAVAWGIFSALCPGGRFVGELGGVGNLAQLRSALRDVLVERGYRMPDVDPSWYPAADEFRSIYSEAGFTDIQIQLIERPTTLPSGHAGWVKTFRSGLLDVAMVPQWEREAIALAVEDRVAARLRRPDGSHFADYVRLRFAMAKPG